jgi:hypothetical protein
LKYLAIFFLFHWFANFQTFAQSSGSSEADCEKDLIEELIKKGYMSQHLCMNLDASKLVVVLNGATYDLGDYGLMGNQKSTPNVPEDNIKKELDENTPTVNHQGTADSENESKDRDAWKTNVKTTKDSLDMVAELITKLSVNVKDKISIESVGYADGVRNKMSQFNENPTSPGFIKNLSKMDSDIEAFKQVSLIRNKNLAIFRAQENLDYLKSKISSNVYSQLEQSVNGENSSTLESGKPKYVGYCKFRRGAKLGINLEGLKKSFAASTEKQIQFRSFPEEGYEKLLSASHSGQIRSALINFVEEPVCAKLKKQLIDLYPKDVTWKLPDGYNRNSKAVTNLALDCFSHPVVFEKYFGMKAGPGLEAHVRKFKDYRDFLDTQSKFNGLTLLDYQAALIFQAHNFIGPPNSGLGERGELSTFYFKNKYIFPDYEKYIEAQIQKLPSLFLNITQKHEKITYDLNLLPQHWSGEIRGFTHSACSSGVAIHKNSKHFIYRSYHIIKEKSPTRYTTNEELAVHSSTRIVELMNAFFSKLYNIYTSTNFENFPSSSIFALQHPTAYLFPTKDCGDLQKNFKFSDLSLPGVIRINFTNDFESKGSLPQKSYSIPNGSRSGCLFLAPVFVAHTKAEPNSAATPEPPQPSDITACQSFVDILKKEKSVNDDKSAIDSIKKHCASINPKAFPWSEDQCRKCSLYGNELSSAQKDQYDKGKWCE